MLLNLSIPLYLYILQFRKIGCKHEEQESFGMELNNQRLKNFDDDSPEEFEDGRYSIKENVYILSSFFNILMY